MRGGPRHSLCLQFWFGHVMLRYVQVCMYACMCVKVWRPEISLGMPFLSHCSPVLFFSSLGPALTEENSRIGWQARELEGPTRLILRAPGLQTHTATASIILWQSNWTSWDFTSFLPEPDCEFFSWPNWLAMNHRLCVTTVVDYSRVA